MLETAFNEFLTDLIEDCLSQTRRPEYYVPEQRQALRLKNNLISNTFIIYGPTGSGKTSSVLWAASFDPEIVVIMIDCEIDTTEIQFVRSVYFGVMGKTKQSTKDEFKIKKNDIPIFENMKFDQLNTYIKESGKKYLFVIKKCEKIAQMKKPTLFYNLLEWINSPMKTYLGLIFLSRAFHFTDRLQKRVKSRLTAKSITLIRPQGEKIIKIYMNRFLALKNQYEQTLLSNKSSHRKQFDQQIKTKIEWLKKIMNTVENSKAFKDLVFHSINAINNQFIACMRTAIIKSLQLHHMNESQNSFSTNFVNMLREAASYISPNLNRNLIIQCPMYTILVLALICYMGITGRLPYKMSTIFEIYKEKVLSEASFNHITGLGSSKAFFQKALKQLLDMRIISWAREDEESGKELTMQDFTAKQLELSIPPEDIQEVISEMDELPEVIKNIVRAN